MPLGHLCSAVLMSGISSTNWLDTSCCIKDLVMLGSEFALDPFSWQIWRRGSSGFCLVFGSHRPIFCKGEKAPEGMPLFKRSATSVSRSWESWSSWWKMSSLNGWNGRIEGSNIWLGKLSCKSCRNGRISSSVINGPAWFLLQALANLVWRLSFRIRDVHFLRTSLKVSCVLGLAQFAELEFPAPSVLRGRKVLWPLGISEVTHQNWK